MCLLRSLATPALLLILVSFMTQGAADAHELHSGLGTQSINLQAIRAESMKRLRAPAIEAVTSDLKGHMLPGATEPLANDSLRPETSNVDSSLNQSSADSADLETLLKITANGLAFLGVAWGGPCLFWGFLNMAAGTRDALKKVAWGVIGATGGVAMPSTVDWLITCCRAAGIFS